MYNMEFKYWKWNKNDIQMKKTSRKTLDMREKNIEEEIIEKCSNIMDVENKREACNARMTDRQHIIQSNINPFMSNNNYLEDINNETQYLRPIDSNCKKNK